MPRRVIVIGAGIGGLTTAALLLQAGLDVTVVEGHIYPGGSAGTFYHQGFRFDAGATLAGGFAPGGPHWRIAGQLGLTWPIHPVDPAWAVDVGDRRVFQWADPARWRQERLAAFPEGEAFWRRQEWLADLAWDVSSPHDLLTLAAALHPRTMLAAPFLTRSIASLLPRNASQTLRTFVDAQLLISAQTTAQSATALYGSAALDLPRRGVNHVQGGIGGLARTLAEWFTGQGGSLHYRQAVTHIETDRGRAVRVRTRKGLELAGDALVANLTPWALAELLGQAAPPRLRREVAQRRPTWGAFTLYLGLDQAALGDLPASHFQVVVDPDRPLGEGNSVFISLSDPRDPSRAPAGGRTATLSTHTQVTRWWIDPEAYQRQREAYTGLVLSAAERAVPGLRSAIRLLLPGTPRTFAFYTRRPQGMVGGFPQSSLFTARAPWTGLPNAWLVGDSIFPGQSTAGVTLGAMRVASEVIRFLA